LVDQLYEIIKERIVSLQLKLGEKIDVQKLAEEFGVSQTPVRDALNRLSQNGLVNTRARVGYYVVDLSEEDITEIYDLRKMFEGYVLESAIENIDFNELRQVKRKMEEIQQETDEKIKKAKFDETDRELHLLIIKNSNNKKLQNLFSQIYDFVRISISMGVEWKTSLKEHIALIDALQEKDLTKAEEILKEHIDNSRDNAIKALESSSHGYNKGMKEMSLFIK
jgi:DNA-binding GntR family transcriptional regulator